MKQSLPGIKAISFVPCHLLSPNIVEKYRAGVPIGVFSLTTPIEHNRNASCEAESEYIGGGYFEKTSLEFTTTDEIQQILELAFVVTDVHDKSYLIGVKEAPFPIVNITTKVDDETNIFLRSRLHFKGRNPLFLARYNFFYGIRGNKTAYFAL